VKFWPRGVRACVCVCVRERERERMNLDGLIVMKFELNYVKLSLK
jgi:hypothetical protein